MMAASAERILAGGLHVALVHQTFDEIGEIPAKE
jgi:hypothetical protein